MARRRQHVDEENQVWPGFVDVLTAILLVTVFLLGVFLASELVLTRSLTDTQEDLERTSREALLLQKQVGSLRSIKQQLEAENEKASRDIGALRSGIAELNLVLEDTNKKREMLTIEVDNLTQDREILRAQRAKDLAAQEKLSGELAELTQLREAEKKERDKIKRDRNTLALELDELRALRDLDKKAKQSLEQQLVSLKEDIAKVNEQLVGAQNRITLGQGEREELAKELARLSLENQKLRQGQDIFDAQIAQKDAEIQDRSNEVSLLNASIATLENRLAQISLQLREAKQRDEENQVTIANLGKDLNQALAQRVNELGQYRSDFFGRVRQAVKSVPGIEIKGDRFVFGSELLFPSASAELNENGQRELASLSEVIRATVDSLPDDVDWVLRIDGHTDIRPIRSPIFGDNRELSMARAMSVLKALARAGIPSERLIATGFGSTRPATGGNSDEDLARNRRIEIKLTTP
ncbi:MAG TPA: hypothetical protein DD656_04105 [Alphaproteobacteria bacterium]|nr:hypothetical protein [Alphaproteobacteria bacterium]